jgi:hypothetical protein
METKATQDDATKHFIMLSSTGEPHNCGHFVKKRHFRKKSQCCTRDNSLITGPILKIISNDTTFRGRKPWSTLPEPTPRSARRKIIFYFPRPLTRLVVHFMPVWQANSISSDIYFWIVLFTDQYYSLQQVAFFQNTNHPIGNLRD